MKGHPKTCGCGPCRSRLPENKRGGRHPVKTCQCSEHVRLRVNSYYEQIEYRMAKTRDALQDGPSRIRPVFVKAYWRKQPNFKRSDPGVRAHLFEEAGDD